MQCGIRFIGMVLVTGTLAMVSARAQAPTPIPAEVTHTWPFSSVVDAIWDGSNVLAASGGGIVHLTSSVTNPQPVSADYQIRSGGLTEQLALSTDLFYAAAGSQGVTRFRRSDNDQVPGFQFEDGAEARTINVVHFPGTTPTDLILVGTNDDEAGGRLLLWTAVADDETELGTPDSFDVEAPVTALASYIPDSDSDRLILLVGTSCGTDGSDPAAVLRFDFDISGGAPTSIPNPESTSWAALVSSEKQPTDVADIVIDPDEDVAYIAAFYRGVFRVDINVASGTLADANGGSTGWPITPQNGEIEYFVDLDLGKPSGSQTLLLASRGIRRVVQEYGGCGTLVPCDGQAANLTKSGLNLFDITSDPPTELGKLQTFPVRRASFRSASTSPIVIDVAGIQHGYYVVTANLATQPVVLAKRGSFDKVDGFACGGKDDVLYMEPNLFVANEIGVQAFDTTLSPTGTALLDEDLAFSGNGGVLLSGFTGGSGYPTMVFGRTLVDIFFYTVDVDANGLAEQINYHDELVAPGGKQVGNLDPRGRGYGVFAMSPDFTPDTRGYAWVVAANRSEATGSGFVAESGVHVWRIKPNSGDPLASEAVELGASFDILTGGQDGVLQSCYVDCPGGPDFSVWCTYGARGAVEDAGIAVYKGTFIEGATERSDKVTLTFVGYVPAFDPELNYTYPDEGDVGGITLYYGSQIHAALGCHGIAMYTAAAPGELPTLAASWPPNGPGTDGRVALSSRVILALSSTPRVYVAFLNGGVGVFDYQTLEEIGEVDTPAQPNGIVAASAGESGLASMYVSDGRGGVHRLELLTDP